MPDRPRILVTALNNALGTALANVTEAKEFLNSPEGWAALEEWLAANRHADDDDKEIT